MGPIWSHLHAEADVLTTTIKRDQIDVNNFRYVLARQIEHAETTRSDHGKQFLIHSSMNEAAIMGGLFKDPGDYFTSS